MRYPERAGDLHVGRRIVEFEQGGTDRAGYGDVPAVVGSPSVRPPHLPERATGGHRSLSFDPRAPRIP